jgi:hypothetical protein
MDFLSLAAVAAPFVGLAVVLAEIVAKKPSALVEILAGSEAFAQSSLVPTPVIRGELIPANDRARLAA